MTAPVTDADIQRGLLVKLELQEAVDRMRGEGLDHQTILAGIASLANDIIAKEHTQATAAAWFYGMAQNALEQARAKG